MNKSKLLFLIVLFIAMTPAAEAFSGLGSGTTGDPYQITTCIQLQEMQLDLDAHYRLENHIECATSATWNSGRGFVPVGTSSAPFIGSLDGQNFEIRNLFIERADNIPGEGLGDENYVGLFGYSSNATLERIRFVRAYVKGYRYVGALVGQADGGRIENVHVNVGIVYNGEDACYDAVSDQTVCVWARYGAYGGGVVGNAENVALRRLVVGGEVKGSGDYIGGIVGTMLDSSLEYATSTAWVDGGENIGGIVGGGENSTVRYVLFSGEVSSFIENLASKFSNNAGGIAGIFSDGSLLEFATSTGRVSGVQHVGGLIGRLSDSSLLRSTASGQVRGAQIVGGAVGRAEGGSISFTRASGNIVFLANPFSPLDGDNFGGFVGIAGSMTIGNNSAAGNVTGDQVIGGFAGNITSSSVTDSYATGQVTGTFEVGGFSGFSGCSATFTRVYATGDVSGSGSYVGGFTGSDGCEGPGSTMSQVFASGAVNGGGDYVGGFIGAGNGVTITDAYTSGSVTGDNFVGGFAGEFNGGILTNVYARGLVTIGNGIVVGGLVGSGNDSTVTNSFWNTETTDKATSLGGAGRTTSQMKTLNTFTDASWNFTTIWGINSTQNNGYPFFRFQGFIHNPPAEVTPPASSGGGGGTGTSVPRRVARLEAQGNIEQAEELRRLFPSIFGTNGTTAPTTLQQQLADLILQFRTLTGRDPVLGTAGATTSTATGTLGMVNLTTGDSGADVELLQRFLINEGYSIPAGITGFFGSQTRDALARFQSDKGITPALGFYGPITRAVIQRLYPNITLR